MVTDETNVASNRVRRSPSALAGSIPSLASAVRTATRLRGSRRRLTSRPSGEATWACTSGAHAWKAVLARSRKASSPSSPSGPPLCSMSWSATSEPASSRASLVGK